MDETREPIYQPDQLIVDLQSWDAVAAKLNDLHVGFGAADVHEGLGLVRLRDLADAEGEPLGVDELLAVLRHDFAAERDGFVPDLGKNRFVDNTVGLGTKIMSSGVIGLGTKIMAGGVTVQGTKIMQGALPQPAAQLGPVAVDIPAGGGAGVRIGLVDTPVRTATAAQLDLRVLGDALADAPEPVPFRLGHGTFVSAIVRRYAPAAEILLAPLLTGAGARADSWDVAAAMIELVDRHGVDVLNLSLGCFAAGSGAPLVMSRVIERIGRRALVVAAAGNHGGFVGLMRGRTAHTASWPAAHLAVVGVGSVDGNGGRSAFSPDLPWIGCLAPGEDVVSAYPDVVDVPTPDGSTTTTDFPAGLARWSGTSFSAALVSGGIAARMAQGGYDAARAAFAALLKELP